MTRPALQHTWPQWEPPVDDPSAPEEDWRETQHGHMRIVRNRKRARLLRKRGVPMWRNGRNWLWFVERAKDKR